MARIRSIKPDFFTSEVIATLPISARLTFIGLWTHVDDNGVCLDNDRLILAAVWPLEEDPTETLQRLREDLQRLREALLIARYEVDGKRYLFIVNWDEHQKVSHPKKPRFPRPTPDQIKPPIRENDDPPAIFAKSSGDLPEDGWKPLENLRPEQGAGSREQGAGKVPPSADADASHAEPGEERSETDGQRINRLTKTYTDRVKLSPFLAVQGIVKKAVGGGYTDQQIERGLATLADEGRPVTANTLRIAIEGFTSSRRNNGNGHRHQPFRNPDPADYDLPL